MPESNVWCAKCELSLPEDPPGGPRVPCPRCGATARVVDMEFHSNIDAHDSWRAQLKRPSLPSDRKLRWDSFSGHEYNHELGKMVRKERTLDKDLDQYVERLIDIESGEIIHECVEPLSEHTGHGSAKKKRP
jgi:hypothetical protein